MFLYRFGWLHCAVIFGALTNARAIQGEVPELNEFSGNYQAFDRFHSETKPSVLQVTAEWVPDQGVVLHDGKCSYQPNGETDCFDPTQSEEALGCSRPKLSPFGTHWLYLHHAIQTKDGEERQRWELPLWAWDHIWQPGEGAYYIWGAGKESRVQELWRLQPNGTKSKVFSGPAELSGGIAPLPERPNCLALTTYALADEICGGISTIWQWCPRVTKLKKLHTFKGCSGRLTVTNDRFLVGSTDDLRSFDRRTLEEEPVKVSEAVIGHGVLPDGRLMVVRWNSRHVRVYAVGKPPLQSPPQKDPPQKNPSQKDPPQKDPSAFEKESGDSVSANTGSFESKRSSGNAVSANQPKALKVLELR